MRVLICWCRVSGYIGACWRRLSELENVDLRVVAWSTAEGRDQSLFDEAVVDGVNCRLLSFEERDDVELVRKEIKEWNPDIIVTSGWASAAYRSAIQSLGAERPATMMAIDTPWKGTSHGLWTRLRHRRFLRSIDSVMVAGERSWQFARHLGFDERQLFRGTYGWDDSVQSPRRSGRRLDRRFVYVGRLAEEKGLHTLLAAYRIYRSSVADPWSLTICGGGPLEHLLGNEDVDFRGFVQPIDLPSVLAEADVFLLPSHFEPWGVALAEAMGAGLPAIATEACGAAIDLIRSHWNGLLVPAGRIPELAEALHWFHDNAQDLQKMGQCAMSSAEPFSASNWAVRWRAALSTVLRHHTG